VAADRQPFAAALPCCGAPVFLDATSRSATSALVVGAYQHHSANGTISNPTDLIVAWVRWYVPAPIRLRLQCEGSPAAVGTCVLTARCLVMAANHLNRVLIDNSEFLEAVELMLLRRESASPAARRDIDSAIERLNEGDVPADQLRVYWRETTQEGDTVVHITAGPALLELALPSNDDTD
jgi:hypothetical protein